MAPVTYLHPDDPPDFFPDPAGASADPNGLLAIGGDLTPRRLLAAYRQGIFPWYEPGQPILWWSPDPRAILLPDELHISRSLRRSLRRSEYQTSVDTAFPAVISACASLRQTAGTWITAEMAAAYRRLHELGYAHSVETWRGTELVGGLYGIALGRVFFGESMFSTASDASKVALVKLVSVLVARSFELVDCQVANPHLASLGSRLMQRPEFLARIRLLTDTRNDTSDWRAAPEGTGVLAAPGQARAPLHG